MASSAGFPPPSSYRLPGCGATGSRRGTTPLGLGEVSANRFEDDRRGGRSKMPPELSDPKGASGTKERRCIKGVDLPP